MTTQTDTMSMDGKTQYLKIIVSKILYKIYINNNGLGVLMISGRKKHLRINL